MIFPLPTDPLRIYLIIRVYDLFRENIGQIAVWIEKLIQIYCKFII